MVSPDGRWVASHTNHRDADAIMRRQEAGVFVAPLPALGDTEGTSPRLIASTDAALALNPRRDEIAHCHIYTKHAKFSPDGTRLMFVFTNEIEYDVKYGEPRVKDVYAVNADGSDLHFVCHFTWGNHPSWHPNGRQILFNGRCGADGGAERSDPLRFMLADVESGGLSVATDVIAGGGHPPYSPDGTRIAAEYVGRPSNAARVVCVYPEARHAEELVRFTVTDHSHQGTHIHPTWSRDGREVLLNVDQSGHSELWAVEV
jgi:Tol biopolymer transport system component